MYDNSLVISSNSIQPIYTPPNPLSGIILTPKNISRPEASTNEIHFRDAQLEYPVSIPT
jgi:hypothetical protein